MGKRDVKIIFENGEEALIEDTTSSMGFILSRPAYSGKIKRIEVERKVSDIESGSVFDHLYPGHSINLFKELRLDYSVATILLNARSEKCGAKDLLKIEKWYPSPKHLEKINDYFLGLPFFHQRLTLSLIKNYEVADKYKLRAGKGLEKIKW